MFHTLTIGVKLSARIEKNWTVQFNINELRYMLRDLDLCLTQGEIEKSWGLAEFTKIIHDVVRLFIW